MAIFFGYKTAEHLLNSAGAPEFRPSVETPDRCGFVDAHALSSIDWTMFELPADEPLDIMVPSRNDRTRRKGFACHLATSDLPHGAYLEMMPDVFVASPALCLLQRCSDLTYAGRIKLVARFCGTYAQPAGVHQPHASCHARGPEVVHRACASDAWQQARAASH